MLKQPKLTSKAVSPTLMAGFLETEDAPAAAQPSGHNKTHLC